MGTKHFNHVVEKIAAAKRIADHLADRIAHHGIEGQIRELAVRDVIAPFMTQSFVCGTGKIIDTRQQLSRQMDIVIYHRRSVPPILVDGHLGLFPVECVRYAIEIKTRLTAKELRDADLKFLSVANLKSVSSRGGKPGSLPATVLFAFGSDISGSEIDRYLRYNPVSPPPCTVLCVLGKGYWVYDQDGAWHGIDTSGSAEPFREFAFFITGLMNTLAAEELTFGAFNPGAYMAIDDLRLSAVIDPGAKPSIHGTRRRAGPAPDRETVKQGDQSALTRSFPARRRD
jgi:hypothetical protein